MLAQSYPRAGFQEVEPDKPFANFGEATLTGTGMVQGGTSSIRKHRPRRIRTVERQVLANEDSHAAREGQYARSLIRLEQQMPILMLQLGEYEPDGQDNSKPTNIGVLATARVRRRVVRNLTAGLASFI